MFGDLWVCSGQSNMEWSMANKKDAQIDIANCKNRNIRLFTVAKNAAAKKTLQCSGEWLECNPKNLPSFSSVGYYFGRELEKYIDVPIGLINSSWGGTTAESWTSKDALCSVESLKYLVSGRRNVGNKNALKKYLKVSGQKKDIERNSDGALPDPGRAAFTEGWEKNEYYDSKWIPVELPTDIEKLGLEIDGAVWFRKKISLPEFFIGKNLILSLGIIDDFDTSYFNGVEIGSTGKETPNWWTVPRFYRVPAQLISGNNALIAVRVFDHFMNG